MFSWKLLVTFLVLLGLASVWGNADGDVDKDFLKRDVDRDDDEESKELNTKVQEAADTVCEAFQGGQWKRLAKRNWWSKAWAWVKKALKFIGKKKRRYNSFLDAEKRVNGDELDMMARTPNGLEKFVELRKRLLEAKRGDDGPSGECDPEIVAQGEKVKDAMNILHTATALSEDAETQC